jgi:hypothetical protein
MTDHEAVQPERALRRACTFLGAALLVGLFAGAGALQAQDNPDGLYIDVKNSVQFSQTALSNWAPGGESSLALNGDVLAEVRQRRGRFGSQLTTRWLVGLFKAEDVPVRKSHDHLSIAGVSGYHLQDNITVGALANLTTQIAPSYIFDENVVQALGGNPDDRIKTGNLLSPGYLELGLGFQYLWPQPMVGLIVAPIMLKQTIIMDEDIRELDGALPSGLYGNEGKTVRSELGAHLKLVFQAPLMKNVTVSGQGTLFADYADPDIDAMGLLNIGGKINEHLSASINTTFVFNSDVDTDLAKPGKQEKLQVREVLGVKLVYAFSL